MEQTKSSNTHFSVPLIGKLGSETTSRRISRKFSTMLTHQISIPFHRVSCRSCRASGNMTLIHSQKGNQNTHSTSGLLSGSTLTEGLGEENRPSLHLQSIRVHPRSLGVLPSLRKRKRQPPNLFTYESSVRFLVLFLKIISQLSLATSTSTYHISHFRSQPLINPSWTGHCLYIRWSSKMAHSTLLIFHSCLYFIF